MTDRLAERQRLLARGAPALADYALDLEQQLAAARENAIDYPYPLYRGDHHEEIIDTLAGGRVKVVRCASCGHIDLRENIALGSGGISHE